MHHSEIILLDLLAPPIQVKSFPHHIIPWMWHSFYCLNFSLHGIQEIFEQQLSCASITETKLQAFLCLIQYNEWLNICGGLVMPHPHTVQKVGYNLVFPVAY